MRKMKSRYSNNILDKNDLAYEEEVEENGICEPADGIAIASYDFSGDSGQPGSNINNEKNLKEENNPLPDNRKGKILVNSVTPPIDDEPFIYKRCYQLRESTLRMINEIKAKHPDVNVYFNTIIDEAVRYYYRNIYENVEK